MISDTVWWESQDAGPGMNGSPISVMAADVRAPSPLLISDRFLPLEKPRTKQKFVRRWLTRNFIPVLVLLFAYWTPFVLFFFPGSARAAAENLAEKKHLEAKPPRLPLRMSLHRLWKRRSTSTASQPPPADGAARRRATRREILASLGGVAADPWQHDARFHAFLMSSL